MCVLWVTPALSCLCLSCLPSPELPGAGEEGLLLCLHTVPCPGKGPDLLCTSGGAPLCHEENNSADESVLKCRLTRTQLTFPEENVVGSLIHNAGEWWGVLKYCGKELLVCGDVGVERSCMYFSSHLFCLFWGLFRTSPDVIAGFSRALLVQEWKLRVKKGIFAISYFHDKHIYHSD